MNAILLVHAFPGEKKRGKKTCSTLHPNLGQKLNEAEHLFKMYCHLYICYAFFLNIILDISS